MRWSKMGLVVINDRGHLGWGLDHGRLKWLPLFVRTFIVRAWNEYVCGMRGHTMLGVEGVPDRCIHCGKRR